jgi:hypothetical protein
VSLEGGPFVGISDLLGVGGLLYFKDGIYGGVLAAGLLLSLVHPWTRPMSGYRVG